jgi:hypothetical protein
MTALLGLFLRGLFSFAGGVALTSMVDKFVPDKLPAGTAPLYVNKDQTGKINWLRVGLFCVIGAIGIMLVKYIGRKLHIKLLS